MPTTALCGRRGPFGPQMPNRHSQDRLAHLLSRLECAYTGTMMPNVLPELLWRYQSTKSLAASDIHQAGHDSATNIGVGKAARLHLSIRGVTCLLAASPFLYQRLASNLHGSFMLPRITSDRSCKMSLNQKMHVQPYWVSQTRITARAPLKDRCGPL